MFAWIQNWLAASGGKSEPPSRRKESAKTKHEQRTHGRYAIPQKSISQIIIGGHLHLPLIDISYGGLSLSVPEDDIEEVQKLINNPLEGKMHILGDKLDVSLDFVYLDKSKREAGAAFHHKKLDTLIYLRDLLEAFRIGSGIKAEKTDAVTYSLVGENLNIEVKTRDPEDLSILSFRATIPKLKSSPSSTHSANFCEFQSRQWKTGATIQLNADSTPKKREVDDNLSLDTIRFLTIIILGAQAEAHTCIKTFENLLLDKLTEIIEDKSEKKAS